ncbi:PAS domain S-box protein [Paenibacillus caui]|uniref:PAS domain S-box protein n=1 Tax=Paenibacillus caui TaxID=2873927 RepID=UPI001CA94033|nr:PAS domain S-box protein [Paenibacillus caui]
MSFDYKSVNESLFIQAFKYSPIGMALVAANGSFLKVNSAVCSIFGYSKSELKEMSFQEIAHPEDRELDDKLIAELLRYERESYQMEKRYLHKDGNTVWVILAVSLVSDDDTGSPFFIAQFINITEQRHAENSLLEKERLLHERNLLYQSVVDHSFDFITIHSLDGTYLDASASCYEVLGYTPEEMIGKPGFQYLHPDDFQKGIEAQKAVLQDGKQSGSIFRLRKKDGNYLWLEAIAIALPDPVTNQIKEIITVSRDITERMEMIARLEESQKLYRIISENAQDVITFADPDGVIRYASPAVRHLLGYETDEVIGTLMTDNWHPEDLNALLMSGTLHNWDVDRILRRVRHKRGHYVWLEATVKSICNEDGRIVQILCVSRDITMRKQAEDELRTTKERLESFLMNNADAIWLVDCEEVVLETNPAFERLFQWRSEEIINKRLPIVPEYLRDQITELHRQVLSGRSITGYETVRLRKDGSLVETSLTLSPVRDTNGHIIGIAGTCRDISEKKQAEQKLLATKQQLESYINHNIDPVLIINTEYRVARVNRAFEETFGWLSSELVGSVVFDLPNIPGGYKPKLISALNQLKPHSVEATRRRKDGIEIPVTISLFPLLDEARNHSGWAINFRNMTAYKRAEQILINSEKLSIAGQLAAGIAHEIRNPITAIKGFVQLMKSGITEKRLYYDIMSSEIERIEMILSELLILAKPQLVHFERKNIQVLLAQVITLLDTQAIMNNVEIVTEFEPGTSRILCDENQLKQVCINFIKNAIEAMPHGGTVIIQLKRKDENTILLRFMDHGCGIPAHILSRLGQPFYTTKEKGTGLGFMVSKKIIENHHGTVAVFSKENEGTTIEVCLPSAP